MRIDTRPLADRFWPNVAISTPDECWPWTARRTAKGYGQFWAGKEWRAHRLAWEIANGEALGERIVMHSCDNPPCCNPKHLTAGTKADNNRDMRLKGRDRQALGPANRNTKLSEEDKATIIARRGEPLGPLAEQFGVTKSTICRVQRAALCE